MGGDRIVCKFIAKVIPRSASRVGLCFVLIIPYLEAVGLLVQLVVSKLSKIIKADTHCVAMVA